MRRALQSGTLVLLLATGACAPSRPLPPFPSPETLPASSPLRSRWLSPQDAWLRHYLMFGHTDEAVAAFSGHSGIAPSDKLLRALQHGLVLHEAGEYAKSNKAFEWAEMEAERRYTLSLSRQAASLVVNDRVLAYTPTAGELMMIPYYRMLNYLALGDREGAVVEAKKANALYARLKPDPLADCRENALVQYFAGMVERDAGEVNDALVSMRQAEAALDRCADEEGTTAPTALALDLYRTAREAGVRAVADSVAQRYSLKPDTAAADGAGDLLLLLGSGFIGFRAEEALHVPLFSDDVDGLNSRDDGVELVAGRVSHRVRRHLRESGYRDGDWDADGTAAWAAALGGVYVLRLAWPAFRLEAKRPAEVRVQVDDSTASVVAMANLSMVAREELERERPAMLTRLVARGLTKYLIAHEVEEEAEKKGGDLAGFFFGRLANLAANQTERADTRSWSLLPDRISMTRLRLPAGSYHLQIETVGENGAVRTHDLGQVEVTAGGLTVCSDRVWGGDGD
ncbi:MAG TPA: hypothetical protein VFI96_05015 [Longimicrobiaceae bacterium]|nr:hypothetical protein [Longimicrobiaceae bacterium]